jgi:predicted neutral ceramidase superfamily lipid hydrolase
VNPASLNATDLPVLLRGEARPIRGWIEQVRLARLTLCLIAIISGTALFGAAVGSWRDPQQALYTAIKFPLIVLLTTLGTGLLNAMLAPLLGLNLSLRQSLLAVLLSFTIAAVILGGASPLVWFLVWNTPPLVPGARATLSAHSLLLVAQTVIIAFAGIAANVRLLKLLRELSGSRAVSGRVLFAWLGVNLLLGSQLAWILRPFVGSPLLPVEFLRRDAFAGSFFESIFNALKHLF